MGKLAGLKMLNDKKLAVQAKQMQEKQQTGRLAINDGQQAYTALYDAARTVVLTEPTDETAVLCEDLLAFSLQLRMNEASPHAHRDDGHRLSVDDFVIPGPRLPVRRRQQIAQQRAPRRVRQDLPIR